MRTGNAPGNGSCRCRGLRRKRDPTRPESLSASSRSRQSSGSWLPRELLPGEDSAPCPASSLQTPLQGAFAGRALAMPSIQNRDRVRSTDLGNPYPGADDNGRLSRRRGRTGWTQTRGGGSEDLRLALPKRRHQCCQGFCRDFGPGSLAAMASQAAVGGAVVTRADGRSLASSFVVGSGAVAESVAVGRQSFLGCTQSLRCTPSSTSSLPVKCKRLVTTAVIKRQKDYKLDAVIQGEKKLKRVLKIKEILVKQPGTVMSLRDLGKYRRQLGLTGKKRVVALLNRFPAVFDVYEEGSSAKYFRFTAAAKKQYLQEKRLHREMEEVAVTRLRKLLMMSIDKTIAIQKVKHIRRDLGLPEDFGSPEFFSRNKQYFKVGTCGLGPLLMLEEWDPTLAVTALEKANQEKVNARQALEMELAKSVGEEIEEEESVLARTPRFQKKLLALPKGQQIKKKDREKLLRFQEVPAISPYDDKSDLNPATAEAEKAAVLAIHELLSLTLEKKILVDHLTHFRRDFKFSQQIRGMLIRHPEYFYVSLKGARDSVFLREAYENSELKEKDPLVLLKERMSELVVKGRHDENPDDLNDEDDSEDEGDQDGDDDDWDEDDDEGRSVGSVGNASAQTSRERWQQTVEKLAAAPRERW